MEEKTIDKAKALLSKEKEMQDLVKATENLITTTKSVSITRNIEEVKYPDSLDIDLGGPGNRGKIYFNASDMVEARQRMKNYFGLVKERDNLTTERAEAKAKEGE